MDITIKLFATLSKGRFDEKTMNFSENASILNVIEAIGITSDEAAIIFVNGRHAQIEQRLADGDTVSIFPPIGGGEQSLEFN